MIVARPESFIAWLPSYLEMQRHMTIRSAGFVSAVPFIVG
jgi:hypothetical protein